MISRRLAERKLMPQRRTCVGHTRIELTRDPAARPPHWNSSRTVLEQLYNRRVEPSSCLIRRREESVRTLLTRQLASPHRPDYR